MIRLCVAQAKSVVGNKAANLAKIEAILQEHAHAADLAVFPELFVCGYPTGDDAVAMRETFSSLCEPCDGPSFLAISQFAKNHCVAIAYGFGELGANDKP